MQKFICLIILFLTSSANAAVLPNYATNTYQNTQLSRAEQMCIDDGYKITYANCSKQTAPAEKCPHHDNYYKTCSQEQWCKNNNYTLKAEDCQAPFFPYKMCANLQPLYRICKEDIAKSCEAQGFVHKDKCQLTEKKCAFSSDYGTCCDECPKFSHPMDKIPNGYIAQGETCITCGGVIKTNIIPAPCDGFKICQYGPLSPQTPSCLKANTILYSACKTSSDVCKEKGYIQTSCPDVNDVETCPENTNFKRCAINCTKQTQTDFPMADVIEENTTDPILDLTKTELKSLKDSKIAECQGYKRPDITLHINQKNLEMYEHLFDRNIENINFNIIYEEPIPLYANGNLKNIKVTVSGNIPECSFIANQTNISGTVNFYNTSTLCANFNIAEGAKLLSGGDIKGNITMQKDSSLGIKGNLNGLIQANSYTEIFIKGSLKVTDNKLPENSKALIFGCNSKVKIEGGIFVDTTPIYLKQWTVLDTPAITLRSTSDNKLLTDTLSSLHMHKYTKIFNTYESTVFDLAENNNNQCDNMYYIHLGSATDSSKQEFTLQPANLLDGKWQCETLNIKHQMCN